MSFFGEPKRHVPLSKRIGIYRPKPGRLPPLSNRVYFVHNPPSPIIKQAIEQIGKKATWQILKELHFADRHSDKADKRVMEALSEMGELGSVRAYFKKRNIEMRQDAQKYREHKRQILEGLSKVLGGKRNAKVVINSLFYEYNPNITAKQYTASWRKKAEKHGGAEKMVAGIRKYMGDIAKYEREKKRAGPSPVILSKEIFLALEHMVKNNPPRAELKTPKEVKLLTAGKEVKLLTAGNKHRAIKNNKEEGGL